MYTHVYVHLEDKNNTVFVFYISSQKMLFETSMMLTIIHVLRQETFICYNLAKMLDTNYRMIYYITVEALYIRSIQYIR